MTIFEAFGHSFLGLDGIKDSPTSLHVGIDRPNSSNYSIVDFYWSNASKEDLCNSSSRQSTCLHPANKVDNHRRHRDRGSDGSNGRIDILSWVALLVLNFAY